MKKYTLYVILNVLLFSLPMHIQSAEEVGRPHIDESKSKEVQNAKEENIEEYRPKGISHKVFPHLEPNPWYYKGQYRRELDSLFAGDKEAELEKSGSFLKAAIEANQRERMAEQNKKENDNIDERCTANEKCTVNGQYGSKNEG